MSEAELHIIRARLDGGIRNKAAQGELRRGLPVGFIWGEQDGEVLFHPDEAVTGAIRGLRALRRVRLGATGLALVPFRGSVFSAADDAHRHAWPDPLGRSDLPRTPSNPHQSGVWQRSCHALARCWRLHLRQDQV